MDETPEKQNDGWQLNKMGALKRSLLALGIILVGLVGLYWLGRQLMAPSEKTTAPAQVASVACSDNTAYTNLNDALRAPDRVCLLDLHGQGLTELSPNIGHFRNLRVLNLRDNQLTMLPAQIGWLRELTTLDISNNQLREIPPHIGWLRKLETLRAGNNKLQSVPVHLGWLKELKVVDLSDNQLTNLPEHIGWWRGLKEFNLRNNKLTVLPASIGWFGQLGLLDVRGNKLATDASQLAAIRQRLPEAIVVAEEK